MGFKESDIAELVKHADAMVQNTMTFAKQAAANIERLRRAKTALEAAKAGKKIFEWIELVEDQRKFADARFMNILGRLWEFD